MKLALTLALLLALAGCGSTAVTSDSYCTARNAAQRCNQWQFGPTPLKSYEFDQQEKSRKVFPAVPNDDDTPTTATEGASA